MTCNETRNWFADDSLAQDPYPFLAELRSQCPVQPTPHHDVVAGQGLREVGERAHHGDAGRECVVPAEYLGGFFISGHGDNVVMRGRLDRALRSQPGQEWIRVLRYRFVGEPIARLIARHFNPISWRAAAYDRRMASGRRFGSETSSSRGQLLEAAAVTSRRKRKPSNPISPLGDPLS